MESTRGATEAHRAAFGETEMAAHFFAYGTLMCEDIMLAVTGRRFAGVRAFLRDFELRTVSGEVYPGIVARGGKIVECLVYSDLPEVTWRRLDTFEGEMYQRRAIQVEREDGTVKQAQAYVVRPEFEYRLSTAAWTLEEFLETAKERFQT